MSSNKRLKIFDFAVIGFVIIVTTYLYVNLYSADRYAMDRFGTVYLIIIWGIRFGIPLALLSFILVYLNLRRGKISVGNIFLFIFSTVICFFIFFPLGSYYYNRAIRINQKLDMYHPILQLKPIIPHIDTKKDHSFRILCLGGSTTEWGDRVTKIGWPKRVEKILQNQFPDKQIEVLNGGRQWYTTLHTLINFEVNLRQTKPDMVIIMHGINDLLYNADFSYLSQGRFREDYGHFLGAVTRIIARGNFIQKLFNEINFWNNKHRELINTSSFPGLRPFKRNLTTLIELCQNDNIKVVLMTQPTSLNEFMNKAEVRKCYMLKFEAVGPEKRWSYKTAYNGMTSYNKLTAEVAATSKAYLIDLADHIPASFDYFSDEVHYKDNTFDMIAQYVSDELIQFGLID